MPPRRHLVQRLPLRFERLESRTVPSLTPFGPEFRVNTFTTGFQGQSSAACDADGDCVVVWSGQSPADSGDVMLQRYSAAGVAQGPEVPVNVATALSQGAPDVAMDADGDIAVVWESSSQDGNFFGVFARRHDALGRPKGPEFLVNTQTNDDQRAPAVAMDAGGNMVVVWQSDSQDSSGLGVFGQRFDSAGVRLGAEFPVNVFANGNQDQPAVAMAPDGRFVVCWTSDAQDGDLNGVFARLFAADGTPQGGEFLVNTTTLGNQGAPAVAMAWGGEFVVTWQGAEIGAQRFSSAGAKLGGEFTVNTTTNGFQAFPDVAADAAGNAVISWQGPGANGNGVFARRLSAGGTFDGPEFPVNSFTSGEQNAVSVAMDAGGDAILSWASNAQDGDSVGVFAQHFREAPDVAAPFVTGVSLPGSVDYMTPGFTAVTTPVATLAVAFSEAMATAGAGSVTDPGNWFLTRYDGGSAPAVNSVSFGLNSLTNRQEATVNFAAALKAGSYALTARRTLRDPAGNWLNGVPDDAFRFGEDFEFRFAVAPPTRVEPEFRINTTTASSQTRPRIATDGTGGFVMAWESSGQDGSGDSVHFQRYAPDGSLAGPETRANSFTAGDQERPAVAADSAGGFVVVWSSANQEAAGSSFGVYAQRYSATGAVAGPEFRVNTFTTGRQSNAAAAIDSAGNFVVAWDGDGQDGGGAGVFARLFAADGTPRGPEIFVNTFTTGDQTTPTVALDSQGGFVVAWASDGQDGSGSGVFGRVFDGNGIALGAEFRANANTTGVQSQPAVAARADGEFVIAWAGAGPAAGDPTGVFARRFSGIGTALTGDITVNTFTTFVQSEPNVAVDAAGNFVVAWTSGGVSENGPDGSAAGVAFRRFSRAGSPLEGEFVANTFTTGRQQTPAAVVLPGGELFIAWQSEGQDGGGFGIYAQRFAGPTVPASVRLGNDSREVGTGQTVLGTPVSQIVVGFTRAMTTTGPGSFVNTANWQLFRYGADVSNTISNVTFGFNAATGLHDATLNLSTPLTDAAYVVVASGNIQDTFGKVIDGEGDGAFGGSFARIFQVAPQRATGPEFRANTTTANGQSAEGVAADAAGNFVTVWTSNGQDASGDAVVARCYDEFGNPQTGEVQVNVFTTGGQGAAAVARDAAGNFVIVWQSPNQEGAGSGLGIFARRFNPAGVPQGGEFPVNTFTTGIQSGPAVAMDFDGDFVVTWASDNQDGNSTGVFARRFAANGSPLDTVEFLVNTFTTGVQSGPTVAADADGDFVVVWTDSAQEGSLNSGIYARRFNARGLALGGEIHVNTVTTGSQTGPAVSMDLAGNFVVTWSSPGQDGDVGGVIGRRFSAAGVPLGGEFVVNGFTTGGQGGSAIALDADGDFAVAWDGNGSGDDVGVFGRRFRADGLVSGADFAANTTTADSQKGPLITVNATGEAVVIWTGNGQDGSGSGAFARRFAADLTLTTSGIGNVTVPVNSPGTVIDLLPSFDDFEDGPTGLTYSLAGNTNTTLVSAAVGGTSLKVSYTPGATGSAVLTIRATDRDGVPVDTSFSVTVTPPPPKVSTVVINGGTAQRSRVTQIQVIFSAAVTLPVSPATAFQLKRQSDNAVVGLSAVVNSGSSVTLTFGAGPLEFGSLADGRYTLTVFASKVSNANGQLDGNGDGVGGDNFVLVGDPAVAPKLFRLFGDADGDGDVDAVDYGQFRVAFGGASNLAFDFDNDGDVDAVDLGQFRPRFGASI